MEYKCNACSRQNHPRSRPLYLMGWFGIDVVQFITNDRANLIFKFHSVATKNDSTGLKDRCHVVPSGQGLSVGENGSLIHHTLRFTHGEFHAVHALSDAMNRMNQIRSVI